MILPLLLGIKATQHLHNLKLEDFYTYVGITRQGFYQALSRQNQECLQLEGIFKLVNEYRFNIDRRAGSRSLYKNLDIKKKFKVGVTKFERLMSEHGMSLAPLRIKVVTIKAGIIQIW